MTPRAVCRAGFWREAGIMRRIVLVVLLALTAGCTQAAGAPTESLSSATPEISGSPRPSASAPEPVAMAKVPNISGLPSAEAEKILTKARLEVELKKEYSHDPVGSILQQDPVPGSKVAEGTDVRLIVARAYPEVPNIVGKTLSQARRILEHAGFDVGDVRKQVSSQPKDTVLSETPLAGTGALPGRNINLVIAKPASTTTRSNCTPGYSPCLPPAYDYDCIGGSGDGPEYTGLVRVTGSDPYGLDADNDGYGCE
jgi:resuscitation-promoting factor RpfB